jgi:hypothetical protein
MKTVEEKLIALGEKTAVVMAHAAGQRARNRHIIQKVWELDPGTRIAEVIAGGDEEFRLAMEKKYLELTGKPYTGYHGWRKS